MLKDIFISLAGKYSTDTALAATLWQEIEKAYTGKKRHYHSLVHLQDMYDLLVGYKDMITDWDTLLFALFYHDIVYKATRKDNEEQSADVAALRLSGLNYPAEKIARCHAQIMATKLHLPDPDNDTNLLTDADMAILGADWDVYEKYYKGVRKEYAVYPGFLYNPGRAKVLQHFLGTGALFHTKAFRGNYEQSARKNISRELETLI